MLLTIPWVLSVYAGRVTLDEKGEGFYNRKPKLLNKGFWSGQWTRTGVNARNSVKKNSLLMLITCLPYVIIQGVAFGYGCGEKGNGDITAMPSQNVTRIDLNSSSLFGDSLPSGCQAEKEKWFAFTGMILCIVMLVGYLIYQKVAGDKEDKEEVVDQIKTKAIKQGNISLTTAFVDDFMKQVKIF